MRRVLGVFLALVTSGCARQAYSVAAREPVIVDIVDMTDHEAGKKPFYQHTG